MSEPTIRDVLELLSKMREEMVSKAELRTVDGKIDKLDVRVSALDAKVDAHRAETARGFAELDLELAGHSDEVHRRLEAEIEAIKKRLPAVRPPARRPRRT